MNETGQILSVQTTRSDLWAYVRVMLSYCWYLGFPGSDLIVRIMNISFTKVVFFLSEL